ncbi:unnamed protein product [marine sediment metagenome]|uniref:Uncharacterized protein n=1 Tax=marine sediment metagenome TaxID=412755 RepID=X1MP22_9ZZZZ
MPTKQVQAYHSGYAGLLWNAHEHKRAELLGLTVDNQHTAEQKIKLYDGFDTDASKAAATGAIQAAEYLMLSGVGSGLIRLQLTVPAGETIKLGEEDCKGIEFLGRATAVASALSSDCIVIAQYQLK